MSDKFKQDAAIFSLETVPDELLERYEPKFIGRGGDHLVYEIPGHSDIVSKSLLKPLKPVFCGK